MAERSSRQITCRWPDQRNEHGAAMLWLGSWLVGTRGEEGGWFHSARGGAVSQHDVPAEATGLRVRRWPSEGLAAEYVDVIPVPRAALLVDELSFERPQTFSLLGAQPEPV